MSHFGDVRELLQHDPSPEVWALLCTCLMNWSGTDPVRDMIEYCASHLAHWPADLPTFAPPIWFKRDVHVLEHDPRTTFFVYCAQERTTLFLEEAMATLASKKRLKPPGFVNMNALGGMRWRSGEVFSEDDRKRLIVWMRALDASLCDTPFERMRQFLNDEDCQRWSDALYVRWQASGRKPAHRWALFQISYMGKSSHIALRRYKKKHTRQAIEPLNIP